MKLFLDQIAQRDSSVLVARLVNQGNQQGRNNLPLVVSQQGVDLAMPLLLQLSGLLSWVEVEAMKMRQKLRSTKSLPSSFVVRRGESLWKIAIMPNLVPAAQMQNAKEDKVALLTHLVERQLHHLRKKCGLR